ncbi:hypothetical protein PILCRDRAFT_812223 [Piloderma croceum F 1598]|uniref:Uncharacterized protein n=1 Tax=Piloderma croceum (strain F 1598) TaxID=765440 RepID=A0A0C3BV93_PILCF|nr:hypothetical protein PILCRDRAFT_812223 [Piloderma croceum F 1598]
MTAVTVIYRIKYISLIRLYYNCANPFSTPSAAIPSPFSSLSDFDRHILRYSKNPPLLKQCERDPIGNCRGICSFGIPIVSSDTEIRFGECVRAGTARPGKGLIVCTATRVWFLPQQRTRTTLKSSRAAMWW